MYLCKKSCACALKSLVEGAGWKRVISATHHKWVSALDFGFSVKEKKMGAEEPSRRRRYLCSVNKSQVSTTKLRYLNLISASGLL